MVRKDLQVIKRNTLPTFWKVAPSNFIKQYNGSDYVVTFNNGSQILFMGENIDKDPDLNRFRGLEVNGFVLEECNELSETTFFKCIERAGSWQIDKTPQPKIIMTCNPSQNWVKEKFYLPYSAGALEAPYFYLPSSIFDNPHISEEYLLSLKSLPDPIYKRFVDGSWDATDAIDQLIGWADIYASEALIVPAPDDVISLGVDVARYGSDKTVFLLLKGGNLIDIIRYDETSITQVSQKTKELMQHFIINANNVCVDASGLGAGVVDNLYNDDLNVISFVGGSKAIEDDSEYTFKNLKSQAYWYLKEGIHNGELGGISDVRLKNDLTSIHYRIDGEKQIVVESKDDLKKRLGRSPDDGDALCYAWWGRVHEQIARTPGVYVF